MSIGLRFIRLERGRSNDMSSIFKKPKSPDLPEQEQVEEVQKVEDDAEQAKRRELNVAALRQGRQSTILSGIRTALKRRLGE